MYLIWPDRTNRENSDIESKALIELPDLQRFKPRHDQRPDTARAQGSWKTNEARDAGESLAGGPIRQCPAGYNDKNAFTVPGDR